MKKVFLMLCWSLIFISCTKDANDPANQQPVVNGSVQYKVNGGLTIFDNVNLLSGQYVIFYKQLKGIVPDTRYLLNAQNGANNILTLNITTDSLSQINYHYSNTHQYAITFIIDYNGQLATMFSSGDYFDINITSYYQGKISGTFTAKLTPYSGTVLGQAGSIIITEGIINNVQVIY